MDTYSESILLSKKAFGWKNEDLLAFCSYTFLHPDDVEATYQVVEKLKKGVPIVFFQNHYRCANGEYKNFSWTAFPDLRSELIYAIARDITEIVESNHKLNQLAAKLKDANDKLFEQASTDSLTKLKNRRTFNEALNHLVHFSQKQFSPLYLLMIDADHFKDYNDTFGHLEGDKVLITLADLLTKAFRKGDDLLARYGGEEFIVAFPLTSENEAIEISERLIQTVKEFNWEKRSVTISVGITTSNSNSKSINSEYSLNLVE